MKRLLVSAVTLAGGLSTGFTTVAAANHYHDCCGFGATGHALVHGSSEGDNIWHGRSTDNGVFNTRYCAGGSDGRGLKGDSTANSGATCSVQVFGSQTYYKDSEYCFSWGYEDKGVNDNGHYHNHHSPCGAT